MPVVIPIDNTHLPEGNSSIPMEVDDGPTNGDLLTNAIGGGNQSHADGEQQGSTGAPDPPPQAPVVEVPAVITTDNTHLSGQQ